MNERIKELIAECEEYRPGFDGQEDWYTVFNKQKFAELIVGKCAEYAEHAKGIDVDYQKYFKELFFGVES